MRQEHDRSGLATTSRAPRYDVRAFDRRLPIEASFERPRPRAGSKEKNENGNSKSRAPRWNVRREEARAETERSGRSMYQEAKPENGGTTRAERFAFGAKPEISKRPFDCVSGAALGLRSWKARERELACGVEERAARIGHHFASLQFMACSAPAGRPTLR
jgi:hypothetical protein